MEAYRARGSRGKSLSLKIVGESRWSGERCGRWLRSARKENHRRDFRRSWATRSCARRTHAHARAGRGEARSMESGIIADVDRLKESRRGDPLPYLCNERPVRVSCLRPSPEHAQTLSRPYSPTSSLSEPSPPPLVLSSACSLRSAKSVSLKILLFHWVAVDHPHFLFHRLFI